MTNRRTRKLQSVNRVAAALLACVLVALGPSAARAKTIALLLDGPGRGESVAEEFEKEMTGVLGVKLAPQFSRVIADRTRRGVEAALDGVLNDGEVDAVVAVGPVGSQVLSERGALRKPAVAASVFDAPGQSFPLREGASGVKNFFYVSVPGELAQAMRAFSRIVPEASVAVFLSEEQLGGVPQTREVVVEAARGAGLAPTIVGVGSDETPELPDGIKGAFLAPLLDVSEARVRDLVGQLNERALPTFSHRGPVDFEAGVLATAQPANRYRRAARRISLALRDAFSGVDLGEQKVVQSVPVRPALNMATAGRIGFAPSLEMLAQADIRSSDDAGTLRLSLAEAAREAVARNLDLAARDKAVEAGAQDIAIARSALLPQIEVGADAGIIDKDRANASFGGEHQREGAFDASLRQVLYDDRVWALYGAEKHNQTAREHFREQTRLDIVGAAAEAHLGVLRAGAVAQIRQDNLRITRENLEHARSRVQTGSAGRQEVFRWENQVAANQRSVVDAEVETRVAAIAVNEILHRELESAYEPAEPDFEALSFVFDDPALRNGQGSAGFASAIREAMVVEGLARSPEMRRIVAKIEAEERLHKSAKRALYLPRVSAQGDVLSRRHRGGAGDPELSGLPASLQGVELPEEDDTDWRLGVRVEFPLFEGGRKFAELNRSRLELKRMQLEKAALREGIERRVRSAFWRADGAFRKIEMARAGASAARRNYEVLSDSYARGRGTILDLLDAQNAALVADQVAANAEFDFLSALVRTQRAAGFFDFLMDDAERTELRNRLKTRFGRAPGAS